MKLINIIIYITKFFEEVAILYYRNTEIYEKIQKVNDFSLK